MLKLGRKICELIEGFVFNQYVMASGVDIFFHLHPETQLHKFQVEITLIDESISNCF